MLEKPEPPETLTVEGKEWWTKIQNEYQICDDTGLLLLNTVIESFDRMRQCQGAIDRDGPIIKDRFGQDRAHPLLQIEKDAKNQMFQAIKMLNLDLEPPGKPGQKPKGY